MVWRIAAVLLCRRQSAVAAPLVPPSDQAGRERYRFDAVAARPLHAAEPAAPSPLLRWDCDQRGIARQAALPAEPELLSGMPVWR